MDCAQNRGAASKCGAVAEGIGAHVTEQRGVAGRLSIHFVRGSVLCSAGKSNTY